MPLVVHFLNVGRGDCTIIEFPSGRVGMVDIDNLKALDSMVLKISYKGKAIVLGGDATAEETWPTISPITDMQGISVLKASHHGRRSGFYAPAVKEMAPWLTITSVGEKAHDATESYRRYSTHTVSLRDAGDIRITVNDDGTWTYSPNVAQHWKPKREG